MARSQRRFSNFYSCLILIVFESRISEKYFRSRWNVTGTSTSAFDLPKETRVARYRPLAGSPHLWQSFANRKVALPIVTFGEHPSICHVARSWNGAFSLSLSRSTIYRSCTFSFKDGSSRHDYRPLAETSHDESLGSRCNTIDLSIARKNLRKRRTRMLSVLINLRRFLSQTLLPFLLSR